MTDDKPLTNALPSRVDWVWPRLLPQQRQHGAQ